MLCVYQHTPFEKTFSSFFFKFAFQLPGQKLAILWDGKLVIMSFSAFMFSELVQSFISGTYIVWLTNNLIHMIFNTTFDLQDNCIHN